MTRSKKGVQREVGEEITMLKGTNCCGDGHDGVRGTVGQMQLVSDNATAVCFDDPLQQSDPPDAPAHVPSSKSSGSNLGLILGLSLGVGVGLMLLTAGVGLFLVVGKHHKKKRRVRVIPATYPVLFALDPIRRMGLVFWGIWGWMQTCVITSGCLCGSGEYEPFETNLEVLCRASEARNRLWGRTRNHNGTAGLTLDEQVENGRDRRRSPFLSPVFPRCWHVCIGIPTKISGAYIVR